jgi:isopenicillin N synthase-like dioxygenase
VTNHRMRELERETAMGIAGTESTDREIRRIDVSDFAVRADQIADELWSAATDIGFFQLVGHGIDADAAFTAAQAYFALPADVKARHRMAPGTNAGWEYRSQVRPSTRTPDEKESYQITLPRMSGLWPTADELAGFEATLRDFERQCWELAMRVLECFSARLGLPGGHFTAAHDPDSPDYQSTVRLLHYFAFPQELVGDPTVWRAGAHTDFDALTLLFQRSGQDGLQVLPGAQAAGREWTPVPADSAAITCNIGDMLMRWSDDQLKSNFHRVRPPRPGEYLGPRYTIAFFAQANRDVLIDPPGGSYEPITAGDYLTQRIAANFAK